MNKCFTFIVSLFSLVSFSQDIIKTNENEDIESKVKEINIDVIKYKKFNNLTGPDYFIRKSDVKKITFENGSQEIFENPENNVKKSLQETKLFIIENINEHCFEKESFKFKHRYFASFEKNLLRLQVLSSDGLKTINDGELYDISNVYKFHKISERGNNFAFLNIYVPTLVKKNKWKKTKLVIRVKGIENAKFIQNALKYFHELTSDKTIDEF